MFKRCIAVFTDPDTEIVKEFNFGFSLENVHLVHESLEDSNDSIIHMFNGDLYRVKIPFTILYNEWVMVKRGFMLS